MAQESLVEAGLKLARSKKLSSNVGSIHIDRTIYHTVQLTDSDGKVLTDKEGNPLITNTPYILAGSTVSEAVYEIAMEKEKEFKELNELFRNDMVSKNPNGNWRIRKIDQTSLSIQGGR